MNTLNSIFDWMLGAGLRASVLVLVVLAVQWIFKNRLPSRWRYALWLPVLVALLVPALPLLPSWAKWPTQQANTASAVVTPKVPAPSMVPAQPVENAALSPRLEFGAVVPTIQPIAAPATQPVNWRAWLVAAWLSGAAGAGLFVAASFAWSLRRIRRGARVVDGDLLARIAQTAKAVGLRCAPRVLQSPAIASPSVCGLWRPTLLLNADFPAALTDDEADMVLRHELTHIRRGDLAVNALLCALLALHWWNPLLWLAFARVRADREAACDADVLRDETAPRRAAYGHTLLKMETACTPSGLCLGFVGILQRGDTLRERIHSIIAQPKLSLFMKTTLTLSILAIAILGLAKAAEPKQDDRTLIREAVKKFTEKSFPRKPDEVVTHGINTSKGRLELSSVEAKKNKAGRFYTEGKPRPTGYFVLPRAVWAEDAAEAERMLLEDYEKGNFMPQKAAVPTEAAASAVEDLAFFVEEYTNPFKGVKPLAEYADPDEFYSEVAKVVGIPKFAQAAVAKKYGWSDADGTISKAIVKRVPTLWQVAVMRFKIDPKTGKPDAKSVEIKSVHVNDRYAATFPPDEPSASPASSVPLKTDVSAPGEHQHQATGPASAPDKTTVAVEDVAFFEKKYATKIEGVKPIGDYDDPDEFYSAIARRLGIPKLAQAAAAKEFGWAAGDGQMSRAVVKRAPGQWQVMLVRFPKKLADGKPDMNNFKTHMVTLDDDGKASFPPEPGQEPSPVPLFRKKADKPGAALGEQQSVRFANLQSGDYTFTITHIAKRPAVRLPGDPIPDNAFAKTNSKPASTLTFSDDLREVTLSDHPATAVLESENATKRIYRLSKGVERLPGAPPELSFTQTDAGVLVQLTHFGSGVPVIESYRGTLEKK